MDCYFIIIIAITIITAFVWLFGCNLFPFLSALFNLLSSFVAGRVSYYHQRRGWKSRRESVTLSPRHFQLSRASTSLHCIIFYFFPAADIT